MLGKKAQLEGGQELAALQHKDFDNGSILKRIIQAVNDLAKNVGASAVGKVDPPPPINSIQVQGTQSGNTITAPSEILHLTLTHNGELNKGVQYLHEISTDPNFLDASTHVIDAGSSRSLFVHLPAKDSNNKPQAYYHRAYPQMHGSDAQKPTVLGGLAAPTKIVMTGTSQTTLLPSTGSGTSSARGQGLGVVLTRPAPGPKRSVA
jgi:hypothetical protein